MSDIGGLDTVEETAEEKVVEMTEKKERKPFHCWTVNKRDYRLKLKASTIGKLENKYRQNILNGTMGSWNELYKGSEPVLLLV